MSPLIISDPVAANRKRVSSTSRWMSMPIALMMLCFIAAFPPVANGLVALDATLHANNDAIVTSILWITPFALVVVAVAGLVAMYRGRPTAA